MPITTMIETTREGFSRKKSDYFTITRNNPFIYSVLCLAITNPFFPKNPLYSRNSVNSVNMAILGTKMLTLHACRHVASTASTSGTKLLTLLKIHGLHKQKVLTLLMVLLTLLFSVASTSLRHEPTPVFTLFTLLTLFCLLWGIPPPRNSPRKSKVRHDATQYPLCFYQGEKGRERQNESIHGI